MVIPPAIVDLRQPDREQVSTPPSPWTWIYGPLLAVALPTAVITGYLLLWASPRYTAEASVVLKSTNPRESAGITIAAGFSLGSGSSDDRVLAAQLQSRDLAVAVDRAIGLRQHWQDRSHDVVSRLTADATAENYLDYFRSHVGVHLDPVSGLVNVSFQAYDPAYAQRALAAVLAEAEAAVNRAGHDLVAERLAVFSEEVERTKRELDQATAIAIAFQAEHRLVDAKGQAVSAAGMLANLDAQLAIERTGLSEQLTQLGDGNPEIGVRRARLTALAGERDRLVASLVGDAKAGPEAINALVARQTMLDLQLQRATAAHEAASTAREQARVEASHKLRHLITIDQPSLPEERSHPRVLYWSVTLAAMLGILYAVGAMIVTTIREHRD